MVTIDANYGAMAAGHDGLVATWQRIEGHLADLDRIAASTQDMKAEALTSYLTLKARWSAAAQERQAALRSLSDLIDQAREHYQRVDAALAAQFGG